MNKTTQKRNRYNTDVIKKISEKYSVTRRYIQQCLLGDRTGIFPDKVKQEYNTLKSQVEEVLNNSLNKD